MHRYLLGGVLAGSMCLLLTPSAAPAQDVGGLAVWATSSNAELPHPSGVGLSVELDAAGLGFRLSYLRYSDSTRKQGVVCQVYSPRIGCVIEGVDTSARLGGLRLDLLKTVALGDRVRLGAGGGVSFNSLTSETTGDSGRAADLHLPNTGQIGRQATFTVSVAPVPAIPLRIVGTYALHWVRFKGCVDPEDPTSGYAPFCGTDRFREIQMGASFTLPRQ